MFEQAKKLIDNSKKIYIVGHTSPDGDAIGSSFAMCLALKKIGKDAKVLITDYSDTFKFLPDFDTHVMNVIEDEYDLLIAVDSSDKTRLDISEKDINKAKSILMIDHHKMSAPYGTVNCIQDNMPATCQIMYEFISYLDIDIDIDIATYLYTGIMTDTGSFNYSSTNARTMEIASILVSKGINFSDICRRLNETIKESKLKLIAKTIERMEVFFDGKVRYSYVDYDTIQKLGLDEEDAEGMTNYLKMVENTEVAIYIRGKSNGSYKVSLRSAGNIKVSDIAIAFGGGGHPRAAGYTIEEDISLGKKKLLEVLEVILK
ncbi:Bifunctional oligoribonuclease and PAP phosphatase NrnA [compost metagenome]